uniref:Uncharacterized protein n=1 Tax=Rhizophora mucronata TaxID=61149 RepID=A0A2P2QQT9_RHIMU
MTINGVGENAGITMCTVLSLTPQTGRLPKETSTLTYLFPLSPYLGNQKPSTRAFDLRAISSVVSPMRPRTLAKSVQERDHRVIRRRSHHNHRFGPAFY